MTRDAAVKSVQRLFGAKAYWRAGNELSSPEKRDAARSQREGIKASIAVIDAEILERMKQAGILDLQAKRHALRKQEQALAGLSVYKKFSVGRSNGVFATVLGSGDTWEEAIESASTGVKP